MSRSIPVTRIRLPSRAQRVLVASVTCAALGGCAAINADFPNTTNPSQPPECHSGKFWIAVDVALAALALATTNVGENSSAGDYVTGSLGMLTLTSAGVGTWSAVSCSRARRAHKAWFAEQRAELARKEQELKSALGRLQDATERRERKIHDLQAQLQAREGQAREPAPESESQNEDVRACRRGERSLSACKELASGYTETGMKAFEAGEYDQAIEAYTNAHDIVPHPLLLYNRADSYRMKSESLRSALQSRAELDAYRQTLGRSLNDYSIYLQTVDQPRRHRYVKGVMAALEAEIRRANDEIEKLDEATNAGEPASDAPQVPDGPRETPGVESEEQRER